LSSLPSPSPPTSASTPQLPLPSQSVIRRFISRCLRHLRRRQPSRGRIIERDFTKSFSVVNQATVNTSWPQSPSYSSPSPSRPMISAVTGPQAPVERSPMAVRVMCVTCHTSLVTCHTSHDFQAISCISTPKMPRRPLLRPLLSHHPPPLPRSYRRTLSASHSRLRLFAQQASGATTKSKCQLQTRCVTLRSHSSPASAMRPIMPLPPSLASAGVCASDSGDDDRDIDR
jgi:hypothetical protein